MADDRSDAALVLAARAGDDLARSLLFRRYASMVNGMVYRLLGSRQEMSDLVQEVFVEALSSLHRLKQPEVFRSWLGSIAVRTVHRHLRSRMIRRRLGLDAPEGLDVEAHIAAGAPPDVVTEARRIYEALGKLPPALRIALVLRKVEGLTLVEVARNMNVSLATAKRWLSKAEAKVGLSGT